MAAAEGKLWVDTGFWGGVVPGNADELRPLWDAGVFGFKCFLVPSGVAEFAQVTDRDLREALPELATLRAPLLVHAESLKVIAEANDALNPEHVRHKYGIFLPPNKYATWLAYRPRAAENEAIDYLIGLAREFRVPIHVVHLSSSDVVAYFACGEVIGNQYYRRNLPALSDVYRRRDRGRCNGIQMRATDSQRGQSRDALGCIA